MDTATGLELRIVPVDEPGRILARVSRTSSWVADDASTVVQLLARWADGFFGQGDFDAVRAIAGRPPVGQPPPARPDASGTGRRPAHRAVESG